MPHANSSVLFAEPAVNITKRSDGSILV